MIQPHALTRIARRKDTDDRYRIGEGGWLEVYVRETATWERNAFNVGPEMVDVFVQLLA